MFILHIIGRQKTYEMSQVFFSFEADAVFSLTFGNQSVLYLKQLNIFNSLMCYVEYVIAFCIYPKGYSLNTVCLAF